MSRGLEMAASIGHTVRENGIEVVAIIRPPEPDPIEDTIPTKTAIYEAGHAVVGRKRGKRVRGLSVIPGPGYKGVTWMDFDPVAAMIHPGDGDGHDRLITILQGHNPDSAAATANGYKRDNAKAILRVAKAVTAKGTIGGTELDAQIAHAENPPKPSATVLVKNEEGDSKKIDNVPVNKGIVIFDIIDLAPDAKKEILAKERAEKELDAQIPEIPNTVEELAALGKWEDEAKLANVRAELATLSSSRT